MHFSKICRWAITVVTAGAMFAGTGCKKTAKTDPFPLSGQVADWQKTSDTRIFAAKDLWQYIDGDAEQYLKAGVVSAATSDYKYRNQVEAVVDVYTMGDAAGAHTILAGEHATSNESVSVGDETIALQQSVTFRKGPYLVRIVAYELTPETEQALLALARGVEAKL